MHIAKIILVLLTIGALALAPTVATAQTTFTFDKTSANWDTPTNWDPTTGPPQAGDTAIILDGQLCKVEDDHQAVKILDVRSGGTLKIRGKRLKVGADATSTTTSVSGDISFTKVSGYVGRIQINGTVTINGSGTIGKRGAAFEGWVTPVGEAGVPLLKLGANIDLQGDLEIRCNLEVNSTLTIDSSDDLITLGHAQVMNLLSTELSGTGKFSVTGGELRFRIISFDATSTPEWEVSAGQITIDPISRGFSTNSPFITVSGGTLDIQDDFTVNGGLSFTGGTIKVAVDQTATFE